MDPIAEDVWSVTEKNGNEKMIRLSVGRPFRNPESEHGDYLCPIDVDGRLTNINGVGPVDALVNAAMNIKDYMNSIEQKFTPRAEED